MDQISIRAKPQHIYRRPMGAHCGDSIVSGCLGGRGFNMYRQLQRLLLQTYSSSQSLLARSPCVCVLPHQISGCHIATQPTVTPDNILHSHLPDINIPTNVPFHQFLFDKCDQYKNLTAVEEFLTGKKYTYQQLKEKSVKVARGLYNMGYRKGDIVLAFSPNQIDYTVLMLACATIGVWFCAANPAFTADELNRQVVHSNCKAIFTIPFFAGTVKAAVEIKSQPNNVKDLFVFGEAPGFQPFDNLISGDGLTYPDVDIDPVNDVLALPYSSGTTGLPKGVMLTHHNLMSNCLQALTSIRATTEDRSLGLLPLYHIYGMTAVQFSILYSGSSITFLPKFEPESFLKCLQDKKITLAHLVPPLIIFLAKHPVVSAFNLTSLRTVISGAAPLGAEVTLEFLKRFTHGVSVNQGYGLTETSPVINVDVTGTPGSIGNLVANTQGKIVDLETNKILGVGETGEFCVKGPQIMKGYYKDKSATDQMIEPEGWLHTGDIGYYTKDGLVFIKDRLKELIKYKGSQVPPAELEALLLGHPDVQDVAVLGVPDEESGELPRAFVVKKPGSKVTEEVLIKYVEERVAHTKRLRGGVLFIDEVCKNPSGKILRRIMRDKYLKS
ncbi:4-coumarate--CoA ligase 1 [Bulinus truncatus]|nr:4-coumarate--CoA ligase 1 [Bulinus truncatus]